MPSEYSTEDLIKIVEAAVEKSVQKNLKSCYCSLSDDAAKEMSHFTGYITDIGNGDMRKGIEVLREHSLFVRGLIGTRDKISKIVSTSLLVSMITGFIALLWLAVKVAIVNIVKGVN